MCKRREVLGEVLGQDEREEGEGEEGEEAVERARASVTGGGDS